MSHATQQFLCIRVDLRRPTLDLAGARNVTGLDENLIKQQIDVGSLVAWDISRNFSPITHHASRCEYRILAASAAAWPQHLDFGLWTLDNLALSIYGALTLLGPGAFITGTHFRRAWNCDSGHMINLVADGTLSLVPKTKYGRGRSNTPCITWASAVAFLKSRRL